MFDINLLRNDLAATAERMKARNYVIDTAAFEALEAERKALQIQTQELQQQRNTLSKAVGQAKAAKDDAKAQTLLAEVAAVPNKVKANELALAAVQERVNAILMTMPNLPQADVPMGKDSDENVEQRRWSPDKSGPRAFDFEVKDHVALGEALASAAGPQLDFEAGVKLSGTRFTVMRGPLARMHRALAQFMLDTHVNEHGFTECYVPYIVNAESMTGTGQLPKFEEDLFKVPMPIGDSEEGGEVKNRYLIPTSQVSLTNLVRDTRGMIRQHQFDKVEMVYITKPEESNVMLEEMTGNAEKILQKLELPYRVMLLRVARRGHCLRIRAKQMDRNCVLPLRRVATSHANRGHCAAYHHLGAKPDRIAGDLRHNGSA